MSCDGACSNNCTCTDCSCLGTGISPGCSQPYYCVMDPLAPVVEGPCTQDGECPPGEACLSGSCINAGAPCVLDRDCVTGACPYRGSGQTGICR